MFRPIPLQFQEFIDTLKTQTPELLPTAAPPVESRRHNHEPRRSKAPSVSNQQHLRSSAQLQHSGGEVEGANVGSMPMPAPAALVAEGRPVGEGTIATASSVGDSNSSECSVSGSSSSQWK